MYYALFGIMFCFLAIDVLMGIMAFKEVKKNEDPSDFFFLILLLMSIGLAMPCAWLLLEAINGIMFK